MIITTKQELRTAILDRILNQKEEEAISKSQAILEKFLALPVFEQAKTIMFYASIKGEVSTCAMIERALNSKKRVALPLVQKKPKKLIPLEITASGHLTKGAFNIPEPQFAPDRLIRPESLDLVVVPGVAFDSQNNRLGRGFGFYDSFLSEISSRTPVLGLAYEFQLVDKIPGLEAHDRPVTQVITN